MRALQHDPPFSPGPPHPHGCKQLLARALPALPSHRVGLTQTCGAPACCCSPPSWAWLGKVRGSIERRSGRRCALEAAARCCNLPPTPQIGPPPAAFAVQCNYKMSRGDTFFDVSSLVQRV